MVTQQHTRTQALRDGGAQRRNRGDSAPFVVWGDGYAWLEGLVTDLWQGKWGDVARMRVLAASTNLVAADGKDQDRVEIPVEEDSVVNVGLSYAQLAGSLTEEDQGQTFHVAFVGWAKTKAGQQLRRFEVYPMNGDASDGQDSLPF